MWLSHMKAVPDAVEATEDCWGSSGFLGEGAGASGRLPKTFLRGQQSW